MPKTKKSSTPTVESLQAELTEIQIELADLRSYRDNIVASSAAYRETQDKLRADAARYRYLRSEIINELERQQLVKGPRIALQEYDRMVDRKIAGQSVEQNLPAVLDALASTIEEPKQEPEE